MHRRELFKIFGSIFVSATLQGCAPFQPELFEEGEEVVPPGGCQSLRNVDEQGDC